MKTFEEIRVVVFADVDIRFATGALETIQDDVARSLPKLRVRRRAQGVCVAETPADHVSVIDVPVMAADRTPGTVEKHFHPTLKAVAAAN